MFVDKIMIKVSGGKGGDGCRSFRRTRSNPRGGPDGGDGGKGGDVIIRVDTNLIGLNHLRGRNHIRGGDGSRGGSKTMRGADGGDTTINVPPGTIVYDNDKGVTLKILDSGSLVVAEGGRGGKGNHSFRSASNRQPNRAEPGQPGEERTVLLRLKSIADAGLIGLPNAGKTTLINALSRSKYRVAPYKFTTTGPQPAVIELDEVAEPLVVMDIPGLVEGASKGKGRGFEFLSHIERTRTLIAVIDQSSEADMPPIDAMKTLKQELSIYSPELVNKVAIVALNKSDLGRRSIPAGAVRAIFPCAVTIYISALGGHNLRRLKTMIYEKTVHRPNFKKEVK